MNCLTELWTSYLNSLFNFRERGNRSPKLLWASLLNLLFLICVFFHRTDLWIFHSVISMQHYWYVEWNVMNKHLLNKPVEYWRKHVKSTIGIWVQVLSACHLLRKRFKALTFICFKVRIQVYHFPFYCSYGRTEVLARYAVNFVRSEDLTPVSSGI